MSLMIFFGLPRDIDGEFRKVSLLDGNGVRWVLGILKEYRKPPPSRTRAATMQIAFTANGERSCNAS